MTNLKEIFPRYTPTYSQELQDNLPSQVEVMNSVNSPWFELVDAGQIVDKVKLSQPSQGYLNVWFWDKYPQYEIEGHLGTQSARTHWESDMKLTSLTGDSQIVETDKEQGIKRLIFRHIRTVDGKDMLTQPHVYGTALLSYAIHHPEDKAFLAQAVTHYSKMHDSLWERRKVPGLNLLAIIHRLESLDASPATRFLPQIGPFTLDGSNRLSFAIGTLYQYAKNKRNINPDRNLKQIEGMVDLPFNVYAALSAYGVAAVWRQIGNEEEAERFTSRANAMTEDLQRYCWDEHKGLFFPLVANKNGIEMKRDNVVTIGSVLPLRLPIKRNKAIHLYQSYQHYFAHVGPGGTPTVSPRETDYYHDDGYPLFQGFSAPFIEKDLTMAMLRIGFIDGAQRHWQHFVDMVKHDKDTVLVNGRSHELFTLGEFYDSRGKSVQGRHKHYPWAGWAAVEFEELQRMNEALFPEK